MKQPAINSIVHLHFVKNFWKEGQSKISLIIFHLIVVPSSASSPMLTKADPASMIHLILSCRTNSSTLPKISGCFGFDRSDVNVARISKCHRDTIFVLLYCMRTYVEENQEVEAPDSGQGKDHVVVPGPGDGDHALDADGPRDKVDHGIPRGMAVVEPVGEEEEEGEEGGEGEYDCPDPPVEGSDEDGLVLLDFQRHQTCHVIDVDRDGVVDDLRPNQCDAKGSWK